MATPRSISDVTLQGERTLPDKFNPCINDTFLDIPSAEIVVVPWKVFQVFPEIMHPSFCTEHGEITYGDDVNVFMSAPNLQPSHLGRLEGFTQTWVVPVSTGESLEDLSVRLSSFPSLLSLTLTARNILEDSIEVPVVVFLSPDSQCIRDLVTRLGRVKENFKSSKKFSVEVDIGPAMTKWGKLVLRREFLSVGGRFCLTNGAMFNHVFDWSNILGCLPCLPCGLVGSSVYRLHRKINYSDELINDMVGIVILGAKGVAAENQQHAVYLLMEWVKVFKLYYCIECRRRVPVKDSQRVNPSFCRCDYRSKSSMSFAMRNKVAPFPEGRETTSQSSDQEAGASLDDTMVSPGGQVTTQGGSDSVSPGGSDGVTSSPKESPLTEECHSQRESDRKDAANTESKEGKPSGDKSSSHKPRKKGKKGTAKQNDSDEEGDSRFAPYRENQTGQVINRKKVMISQNPAVTRPEYNQSMEILSKKHPGGFIPMRAIFKYPRKNRKPGRRPRRADFVEIELEAAKKEEDIEAIAETSEVSLDQGERSGLGHYDIDYDEFDDDDDGFYFIQDKVKSQLDRDPLAQKDLRRFLVHISDPKTGTLNPAFNPGKQPVTSQPSGTNESVV